MIRVCQVVKLVVLRVPHTDSLVPPKFNINTPRKVLVEKSGKSGEHNHKSLLVFMSSGCSLARNS